MRNPLGNIISRGENQIGDNAFYAEDDQVDPGTTLVQVVIHRPCPATPAEGVYSFQMTGLADLTYSMKSFASERGEVIFQHSVENGFLAVGETQHIDTTLTEIVDPVTGEIQAQVKLLVPIDIKPGGFPNSINPRSRGTIPVAIVSSSTFNAPATVDNTSLTFGRTGNEPSLAFCNLSPEDINGDGLLDQVCHFNTEQTGFRAGDTEGTLNGKMVNGARFSGRDSVRIGR